MLSGQICNEHPPRHLHHHHLLCPNCNDHHRIHHHHHHHYWLTECSFYCCFPSPHDKVNKRSVFPSVYAKKCICMQGMYLYAGGEVYKVLELANGQTLRNALRSENIHSCLCICVESICICLCSDRRRICIRQGK